VAKKKLLSLARVGLLKQKAKSRYSGIPGFEVRRNLKIFFAEFKDIFLPNYF
jgi:hypothetical protein